MAPDVQVARLRPGRSRTDSCLRLLVIQPTPFCNVSCSYCYLPDRTSTLRMSAEILESACAAIFGAPFLGTQLDVAWHAGEPLVLPVAWYADAIACMARHAPPALEITHFFQTNGLLLDGEWAAFLARTGARVGLSIDGPADLHDRHRRTRAGGGTHAGAMRALRMLREHDVPFHVITVLTDAALEEPERLFDFYVRNGIAEVGFNVEEIEGANRTSSLAGPAAEARFRSFLARFLGLVWSSRGALRLREAEAAQQAILADRPVVDEQNQPFEILTIGVDGSMSTFSPELLGTLHSRFAGFAFGHVARGCAAMVDDLAFRRAAREIQAGVEACARSCAYFRWCGGGAPANKLFETGRFDATETMHCRLIRQAVLDEVLTQVETHAHGLPAP
ncbi:cyclophane-forming radical SAM/SPASM peptide maturase GrrM/OscB [Sabulicella glaciei]|uniref:GRRM system radical SAM/SPASM domain protein n=1 Tax=Sabulicella glaciei TaxID=2984948 RepID=A0ABT3NSY8_9PROT|nr:cyclophane-forming radical SAM/SPASM peptide maturase GrrM/OscB [Roseococcus sp. MDT2-1-1]MCW8085266.1 GRRM system radical SAM/SPASM domain protein [Roseococcus sp. MDT2-1-1]